MKTSAQPRCAERAGRILGRVWRKVLRLDRNVQGWLVARGVSAGGANTLLWVVKLVLVGALLYLAFWLALLLVLAVGAAYWLTEQHGLPEEDEWPFLGVDELRRSPGYDPSLYNDTSHEMYEDN